MAEKKNFPATRDGIAEPELTHTGVVEDVEWPGAACGRAPPMSTANRGLLDYPELSSKMMKQVTPEGVPLHPINPTGTVLPTPMPAEAA
jgi:hypothetical protein